MPFKTELHAHCREVSPCADLTARQVADRYLAAGYTTMCLTNHFITYILERDGGATWDEQIDFFMHPVKLMQDYTQGKMHILLGAELRFDDHGNDYLLYGVTEEFLRTHPYFLKMRLKDFSELAHENGMLLVQAHPFRNGMKLVNPAYLDGVEVFNGHPGHDSRNDIALAWSKKYNLLRTSGSDFHHPDSVEAGGILTDAPITGNAQLVDILRAQSATLLCTGPAAERDGLQSMPAKADEN